jgi:hypothetical protein
LASDAVLESSAARDAGTDRLNEITDATRPTHSALPAFRILVFDFGKMKSPAWRPSYSCICESGGFASAANVAAYAGAVRGILGLAVLGFGDQ